MTNIRDIAKRAGYSTSTVSRYLNRSGYVSQTAASKIRQVVSELDYVPNSVAQELSLGQTSTIGVVVPHMKHPYFTELVAGIMEAAFAAKYNVSLLKSKYDAKLEVKYLEQLHRKSLAGLIFTSHGIALAQLAEYRKYGPVVCCEDPGSIPISAAFTIREATYLKAFSHLKEQGFQRIALMLSRDYQSSATSKLTINCYRQVFGDLPPAELTLTDVTTFADGYRGAQKYVQLNQQPDFIFTNGDDIAAGVRQYYLDSELPVPPLMGQENQLSSKLMNISTIDHHFRKVGQLAFQLVQHDELQQIPVTSELIIR